jgi:hypothetical protein
MTTYRFEEVKRTAKKRVPCEGCGKKLNRQTTFSQTINPFNRNADGFPKTYREIWDELGAECREWEADVTGFECLACESDRDAA